VGLELMQQCAHEAVQVLEPDPKLS
jgi:hypothetical protein